MIKNFKGMEYKDILRGHLYWTAIPYTKGTPLDFIEDIKQNDNGDRICKIVNKKDGIPCEIAEDASESKSEFNVLIPHKVRISLVLQHDEFNHNNIYHQVFVAPIQTLHREGKTKSYLEKLTIKNELPQAHYLGLHTGREAYVNIGDMKRIHKSLILEKYRIETISEDIITDICNKISTLLDIKEIPACGDCKRNCDNCDLKKLVVNQ